jgi:hypothetical protein
MSVFEQTGKYFLPYEDAEKKKEAIEEFHQLAYDADNEILKYFEEKKCIETTAFQTEETLSKDIEVMVLLSFLSAFS